MLKDLIYEVRLFINIANPFHALIMKLHDRFQ